MKAIIAFSMLLAFGPALPSFGGEPLPDVENVIMGYAVAVVASDECDDIRSIPDAKERLEKMKIFTSFYAVKAGLSADEFRESLDEAGLNGFLLLQLDKNKACQLAMTMFEAVK